MPHRTSPKTSRRSNSTDNGVVVANGGSRNHSGQSTLPPSPSNGPGSANSMVMNGSIKSSADDDAPVDGDNINVVIRVRPLNAREVKNDDYNILQFPGDGGIWIDEQKSESSKLKPFTFNVVFEPEATQEDILDHSGVKRLIDMAVDGFSTTVFCYGQTGSGKTHTLTGPPHLEKVLTDRSKKASWGKFQSKRLDPLHPDHGLVFRSFIHLFEELKRRSDDATYVIKASYLEIYNEKVIDLLNPGTKRSNLRVRWDRRSRAFVVDNLFSIDCEELDDLVAVLEEGLKNRAIGHHNMNEHSSRSHTILTVHIHSEEKASAEDSKGVYITRHGKINFVDLAGSEMTKKTRSEGKTLEEANNINKSLMVLGYCIAQLSSQKSRGGSGGGGPGSSGSGTYPAHGVHIPYRDSNLTKLLADSLAGNGIACISPAKSNQSESSNTLRYAARAKKIKTKPIVVMDPREALIVSLKREVNILQQENNHLRQLLELADSDSGISSFPQENSASLLAQMGMDRGGANQPLDGRDSSASRNGSPLHTALSRQNSVPTAVGGTSSSSRRGSGSNGSRPPSQRSRDTLRQVSSLLFIATPATVRRIDKSRLNELDSSTLVDLIKDYMSENQDLRKENQDLFTVRDMLLRDQELVCRENERLLKKLEDVTSVCCRSPIVPVRPTYSAELLTASMNGSLPRSSGASGSAPDLSSNGATPTHQPHHGNGTPGGRRSRADSRASPTVTTNSAILSGTHHGTNVWSNPLNWNDDNGSTSTTPTPTMASMHGLVGGGGGEEGLLLLRHQECYSAAAANHVAGSGFALRFAPSPPPPIPPPPTSSVRAAHPTGPADENGRHSHPAHKPLTPSHSTDNLHHHAHNGSNGGGGGANGKASYSRLPAKLNKELEKRKIGSSLTNINIADSIRDKSMHRSRDRHGGGRKGSSGGGGGDSPEDLFGVGGNRRKPGHLRDSLAEAAEKYSSTSTLQSGAGEERESRMRRRKERTKKFREKSRSKERSRMDDSSKF